MDALTPSIDSGAAAISAAVRAQAISATSLIELTLARIERLNHATTASRQ